MSSSWNFSARAEPSYEGSEPSRAEPGHFSFQAETELDFFLYIAFLAPFFFLIPKISHFIKKQYYIFATE